MLAAIAVAGTAVVACGDDKDQGGGGATAESEAEVPAPERIADSGAIAFCTSADAPPVTFQEGADFKGVDPDVAREIAKRMGVDADFSLVGFDAFVAAVKSGTCDAFLAGVSNTPERAKQVHFTDYADVGQNYLVQKADEDQIDSEDDLCGMAVAVLIGTTNKAAVDEQSKKCEAEGKSAIDVTIFNKDSDAAQALAQGKVDAWGSGAPTFALYLSRQPDQFVMALPESVRKEPYSIASRLDDSELNAAFKKSVDAMYADGTMDEILKSHGLSDIGLN